MMKNTVTFKYANEEYKAALITLLHDCAGFEQITDDYMESESLQKGIILKYSPVEAAPAVLDRCVHYTER